MDIKDRLKILRSELNITQEQFSKRIGVPQSTYTHYETGLRNLRETYILSICREFNVSEEWLRNGKGKIFNLPTSNDVLDIIKSQGVSTIEEELLKLYFQIDAKIRKSVLENIVNIVHKKEIALEATKKTENDIDKFNRLYAENEESKQKGISKHNLGA
ncbi:hypothetical protein AGMMS49975_28800 [Clostridia bacterium]|nr:hypothetical protein AGMMS49975_28800 [Clostridia bacterium]